MGSIHREVIVRKIVSHFLGSLRGQKVNALIVRGRGGIAVRLVLVVLDDYRIAVLPRMAARGYSSVVLHFVLVILEHGGERIEGVAVGYLIGRGTFRGFGSFGDHEGFE